MIHLLKNFFNSLIISITYIISACCYEPCHSIVIHHCVKKRILIKPFCEDLFALFYKIPLFVSKIHLRNVGSLPAYNGQSFIILKPHVPYRFTIIGVFYIIETDSF